MGLYNMLNGVNAALPVLLSAIGKRPDFFGRFRDVFISQDCTRIYVLSRIGGGNREAYANDWAALRADPLFVSERDDDFDSTYAWITMKPLDEALPMLKAVFSELTEEPELSMRAITDRNIRAIRGEG